MLLAPSLIDAVRREIADAPPPPPPPPVARPAFFKAGSAVNARLPADVPRAPREAELVADFLAQWFNPYLPDTDPAPWAGWGQPYINTDKKWSVPVHVVDSSTPRIRVEYRDPWGTPAFPNSPVFPAVRDYSKDNELAWRLAQGVPIPPVVLTDPFYTAPWNGSARGDCGIAIVDRATGELWEFWLFGVAATGVPYCGYGGWIPDHRQSEGYWTDQGPWDVPPRPTVSKLWGSSATGLSIAGFQVSQAELVAGVIPHAIGVDLMGQAPWNEIVWPAQRGDGNGSSRIPEGTRFRLAPTVDVSAWAGSNATITRTGRMLLKCMQDHGWVVWDNGGAVAVQFEPGPFDWHGGEWANNMFRTFPLNASTLQVVDPAWRP